MSTNHRAEPGPGARPDPAQRSSPNAARRGRLGLVSMQAREPDEAGRTATPLELFFDLVFVVAVSIAAVELHHALSDAHVVEGLAAFAIVFFAIWWAWMNFTWFATSFATDDWLYRVLTFVQMAGVLVLAAGIEDVFADGDFLIVIISYVVMRIALVAQWLRAAAAVPELRSTTLAYAGGISIVQALWLTVLAMPGELQIFAVVALVVAEIGVPALAERRGATPWHSHHITERYGLFTLILLGESLLASTNAIIEALHDQTALPPLIAIAALTLVVTAALWWIYFYPPHHQAIGSLAASLRYGYTHYFIFAAAAALSAGIEVEIDVLTDHSTLGETTASFAVTVPIAIFVLGTWLIAIRPTSDRIVNTAVPLGAVAVLLDPIVPVPTTLTALILIVVVAVLVARPIQQFPSSQSREER